MRCPWYSTWYTLNWKLWCLPSSVLTRVACGNHFLNSVAVFKTWTMFGSRIDFAAVSVKNTFPTPTVCPSFVCTKLLFAGWLFMTVSVRFSSAHLTALAVACLNSCGVNLWFVLACCDCRIKRHAAHNSLSGTKASVVLPFAMSQSRHRRRV